MLISSLFLHSSHRGVVRHVGACSSLSKLPRPWVICTPSNTWFLGLPDFSVPNGISIASAVFAQLTAEIPYTLQWAALPLQKLHLPMGIYTPSITGFLRPIQAHNLKGISISATVFAHMTAECLYTLQWVAPSPLKIAHTHCGIWTAV